VGEAFLVHRKNKIKSTACPTCFGVVLLFSLDVLMAVPPSLHRSVRPLGCFIFEFAGYDFQYTREFKLWLKWKDRFVSAVRLTDTGVHPISSYALWQAFCFGIFLARSTYALIEWSPSAIFIFESSRGSTYNHLLGHVPPSPSS